MIIYVFKYNKKCEGGDFPFYKIADETPETFDKAMLELAEDEVHTCEVIALELPDTTSMAIDYKFCGVVYPTLSIKRHVSKLLSDERYAKRVGSSVYDVRSYISA